MRTTTYKCDRCGAEDTDNKINLVQVGVHVGYYAQRYSCSYGETPKAVFDQEWCKDCRIKTGLIEKPNDPTIEQQPVTLEDLV